MVLGSIELSDRSVRRRGVLRRGGLRFISRQNLKMVRENGLEPSCTCVRQPLKLVRLPISPLALNWFLKKDPQSLGRPPSCQAIGRGTSKSRKIRA